MYRAGRSKRASAEQLYRQCATGDCPPDVKNKIEGDTWADRLLKWFGSVVYFGGLGIGTGRGSGGSTGYRPLGGATSRPTADVIPVRPAVPVDPIGPVDILPVDTINPAGPSIIPLTDITLPDPTVIDIANPTTNLGPGEIDIVSAVDPLTDIDGVGGNPTIFSTAEESAVLDVQPIPPPKRFALDVNNKPTGTHLTVYSSTTHPDPDINIFVTSGFEGEVVGDVEEIPLQEFSTIQEFDVQESAPQSSTPINTLQQFASRAKNLYNRFTEQIQTRNPNFLGQPSRAVRFEFENPAFDDDVSYTFESDIAELRAAPDIDFRDVRVLHRPVYSTTESGLVRVSRLGERATVTTRSGLQLGQPVHFYTDISAIEPTDVIELQPLNDTSHITSTVNSMIDSTIVNPAFDPNVYNEEDLIDTYNETFDNAHLVVSYTDSDGDTILIPTLPPGAPLKTFINDYAAGLHIYNPVFVTSEKPLIPAINTPVTPMLILDITSDDYYLHPSYFKRRKRKRLDLF
uniref:Minor capsid protein L2 n=1 Tax=Human papillomavirus TaxID=10566 RepID=A0A3R5V9F7_9PAPI|nr:MAG: L2 protein [Human papillomavirus]